MLNILPLSLLLTARGSKALIEVKSGDSYDGRLDQVDKFMNIQLLDVVHTSKVIISNNGYKGWKQISQNFRIIDKGKFNKVFQIVTQFFKNPETEKKAQEEAEIYNQQQQQKQKQQKDMKQMKKGQNQKTRGKSQPPPNQKQRK